MAITYGRRVASNSKRMAGGLSKEGFASQIELQSVHIKTKEKEEGSIHYELELFFQDTEDTFAGHFLYATIEDGKVEEITLMG